MQWNTNGKICYTRIYPSIKGYTGDVASHNVHVHMCAVHRTILGP